MSGNVGEWDDYLDLYLKAEHVKGDDHAFVCIDVDEVPKGEDRAVQLVLSTDDEKEYKFDLNKTNIKKLQDLGVPRPKACIGKKIFFNKVKVNNPTTKKEVDGLRIARLE